MIPELTARLKDGNLYRFLDPDWSPGKTLYIQSHPEFVAPDWTACEILVQDPAYEDETVWRTLLETERARLCREHWGEVLDLLRTKTLQDPSPP